MYEWQLDDIRRFDVPMRLKSKIRTKTYVVKYSDLVTSVMDMPAMRLESTAEFFLGRLSDSDTASLRTTLQHLSGKTITLGSTCSGTDVIVPVVMHTFAAINRIFGVSQLIILNIVLYSTVIFTVL